MSESEKLGRRVEKLMFAAKNNRSSYDFSGEEENLGQEICQFPTVLSDFFGQLPAYAVMGRNSCPSSKRKVLLPKLVN